MVTWILIVSSHSRRFVLLPTIPPFFYPRQPQPPKSNQIISFADPHPLTLLESYRSKNMGGGPLLHQPPTSQLSTSSIYPLSFHTLPHSFALKKNSTLLFSSNSELLPKNSGVGGGVAVQFSKENHSSL